MDSFEAIELCITQKGCDGARLSKNMSPVMRTHMCVNCGSCIQSCPTGAIFELQRQICRLCPDCAESPVMFPRDMEALTVESCGAACPIGHYPEGYINLIALGEFEKAWNVITSVNPMPSVLGRICSRPCEEICKRGRLIDAPLPIRAMKRLVADVAQEKGWNNTKHAYARLYDECIAVIGAGPAGVAAAHFLASSGYSVDLFDSSPDLGGMLAKAVPAFRLPQDIIQRDFEAIIEKGVTFHPNVEIGKNPSIADLLTDQFDAVLVATGATRGVKLPIPGADFMGVHNALEFMASVKAGHPVDVGDKAIVIGGGSVATDVARTLLRLGAADVSLVCIEGECDMPALSWELEEALEEGVQFVNSALPIGIGGDWQKVQWVDMEPVTGFTCGVCGMECKTDSAKRFRVEADTVVFAVGQRIDPVVFAGTPQIELNDGTRVVYDPKTNMTTLPGVFVAGDVLAAKGSVVDAVASAIQAAASIDAYLRGRAVSESKIPPAIGAPLEEKIFPVRLEKLGVAGIPTLAPEYAVDCFDEVEAAMDPAKAMEDARRCMQCGYVDVRHEQCIGCGTCARVCPKGDVIRMEKPRTRSSKDEGTEEQS